ncbi:MULTISPECIES: hypothetical protein [Flavobacteriaceae]|jgi:uncharacterized membrane protein|uniref:hypothetical protein n=1 Tax=Flavobacteriaceae TaxID=49546 RepID=UPI002349CB95|nr:hypothetical protein [Muricauda sp. SP22]MDC6361923.1 hypothetical protein [Muricauda sp. SP22]
MKTDYTQKMTVYTSHRQGGFLFVILALSKIGGISFTAMRKCVVLFVILVAALIFAAVSEKKALKIQSNWDQMAVKNSHLPK